MHLPFLALLAGLTATAMAWGNDHYGEFLARRDIDDYESDLLNARDLLEDYLDDLYIRDLMEEEQFLAARGWFGGNSRDKETEKAKKRSDKLRDKYLKENEKQGIRTLSAVQIAEIQRILTGEDHALPQGH